MTNDCVSLKDKYNLKFDYMIFTVLTIKHYINFIKIIIKNTSNNIK